MPIRVFVTADRVRAPMGKQRVEQIVSTALRRERVADAEISVTFVSARGIASLNRRHLGHRGATDVISFPFARDHGSAVLSGDIYIAPEVARENARRHGRRVSEELTRLVVHGTLHVLGYDHPDGEARTRSPMWSVQERLVARLTMKAS